MRLLHRARFHTLVAAVATASAACSLAAEPQERVVGAPTWVHAWQAAPAGLMPNGCANARAPFTQPGRRTLRMVVRPSVDGSAVRLRLSNRLGRETLSLSHVTVARAASGAATEPGSTRDVLVAGQRHIVIGAGSEVVTDPVAFEITVHRAITVSTAISAAGQLTWHPFGPSTTYASPAESGDRAIDARGAAFTTRLNSYPVLAGLDVYTDRSRGTIVALGDSLTDGADAPETGWAGILARRLRSAGKPFAVANAGITCNALLSGNASIGPRAADRFDADVLERAGVSHVVILLGTNDLHSGATAANVIAALTELATRAHGRGIRVIGATVIPENGAGATRNAARVAVNRWIRTTRLLDGFVDFDAAIRHKSDPTRMNPSFRGDNVHPNRRGQAAMGNSIDLDLFERTLGGQ